MASKSTPKNKAATAVKIEPKEPVTRSTEPKEAIVQVRCIVNFWDLKENCQRNLGAIFSASEDRAAHLKNLHLVEVL